MDYYYTIIDGDAGRNLQLEHFLEEYETFQCVAKAADASEGLNLILKFDPQIVFVNLDHQPAESYSMIRELFQYKDQLPVFIGLSRSKNQAYAALKNNFFDYWLLPFDELDIRKTIHRLIKQIPVKPQLKLCLKSYKDFQYLETDEILYLQADNNATDFFMKDGSSVTAFKTLKSFEQKLPPNFVRVHQSYIINTNYVSRINYGKSLCTLRSGKKQLPFSKTYRSNIDQLKERLARTTIGNLN